MTKQGIIKCIKQLTVNYPNTYKQFDEEDMRGLVQSWSIQFHQCEDIKVWIALNKAISACKFAPSIAEIKEYLIEDEIESDEEVWQAIYKAGCNGLYGAETEYQKLPEKIKRIITPGTLREIALADSDSLRFIRKDLLSEYHSFKQSDRQKKLLMLGNEKLIEERSKNEA